MESLSNPIELVRKPQPNNARTRRIASSEPATNDPDGLDPESARGALDGELERVVAASSSALLPAIIWLAVETAMRRGEIVSLRWEHVDLKRRVAHLPATKNGAPPETCHCLLEPSGYFKPCKATAAKKSMSPKLPSSMAA
jgi:integrase